MRLSAPVVFRLRWVAGPRAGRRGGVHARYIATREGVSRDEEPPDPLLHARYLGERPGSTGLFGPDPATPPGLVQVQDEVRGRAWHWQMVLSLREEDARTLGVGGPADWRDLARRVLPQYATALGLPEGRLRWVAAMHRKDGHPHVHVLAWVPDGPDRPPALSRAELRAVRRIVARETYGPVRAQAVAAKTAERDFLIAAGRLNLLRLRRAGLEAQAEHPVPGRLPPAFSRADIRALRARVAALRAQLPARGQVRLAYMPLPVRAEARTAADWILERPQLAPSLAAMEAAVRDLTSLYQTQASTGDGAWRRARDDVRDRLAQVVLRAAAGSGDSAQPRRSGAPPRRGAVGLLTAAHRLVQGERLRAEAGAELARLGDERQAEARATFCRAAEMGAERRL